ncbi:NAD-dependent protein deacetylase [Branchiibius hedensis]|uniref:NAD-dependent protein deacetylase n=1 Tax=Branchiibius hedensis TaxID=672460 RepID=UPI001FE6FEFF|nr:NAD-dependent protein deacetylase [Branchiibius hedensis]
MTDPSVAREAIASAVAAGGVTVLSGAGLSTESGIPDYRTAAGERRIQPMTAAELLATPQARQRYWARSYVGWPRFAAARPNVGHEAVTQLQRAGLVGTVITQNVDGLHQRAGARDVVELHGNLDRVVCMACGQRFPRELIDACFEVLNPGFDRSADAALRPDGDVALDDEEVRAFKVAHCAACGSDLLKPDVVMFGESVPRPLVQDCFEAVENSRSLLVLGSSLAVMSGYRFVRRAAALGIPVLAITHGWTRGDAELTAKLDAPLGPSLVELVKAVGDPINA